MPWRTATAKALFKPQSHTSNVTTPALPWPDRALKCLISTFILYAPPLKGSEVSRVFPWSHLNDHTKGRFVSGGGLLVCYTNLHGLHYAHKKWHTNLSCCHTQDLLGITKSTDHEQSSIRSFIRSAQAQQLKTYLPHIIYNQVLFFCEPQQNHYIPEHKSRLFLVK